MFELTTIAVFVAFLVITIYAISLLVYANQLEELSMKNPEDSICNLHKSEISNLRNLGITLLFVCLFILFTMVLKMFPRLLDYAGSVWGFMAMFLLLFVVSVWSLTVVNKADNKTCNLNAGAVKGFSILTVTICSIVIALVVGFTIFAMTPYGRASRIVRLAKQAKKLDDTVGMLSFI